MSANMQKLFDKSEAMNNRKFSESWQKLIKALGDPYWVFLTKKWAPFDELFICKYVETLGSIRSQEIVKIQWSVAKGIRTWGFPDEWVYPSNMSSIRSLVCLQMGRKCTKGSHDMFTNFPLHLGRQHCMLKCVETSAALRGNNTSKGRKWTRLVGNNSCNNMADAMSTNCEAYSCIF